MIRKVLSYQNGRLIYIITLEILLLLSVTAYILVNIQTNQSKELKLEKDIIEASVIHQFEQLNYIISTLETFYRTFDENDMTYNDLLSVLGEENIETFGITFVSIAPGDVHQVVYPLDQSSELVGETLISSIESHIIGQYYTVTQEGKILVTRNFIGNEIIIAKSIVVDGQNSGTVLLYLDYEVFRQNTINLFENNLYDIALLDNNKSSIIGSSNGDYYEKYLRSDVFYIYLSLSLSDGYVSERQQNSTFSVGSVLIVGLATIAVTLFIYKRSREYINGLIESRVDLIQTMARAAEYRDTVTGHHVIRVSKYSELLGKRYGLSPQEVDDLGQASKMHDIGKIGIEDRILNNPNRYTEEEFNIMKTHTIMGYEIIGEHDDSLLSAARIIALQHHERWNGSGYPHKLKGEEIHIFSRICAIADVFDALVSKRQYKDGWSFDDAFELIIKEDGNHFDPALVKIFRTLKQEFKVITDNYKDN